MTDLQVAWKLTWFGMTVVFFALALVAGAVSLFRLWEPRAPREAEPEGVPPEVVAAISAAVALAFGGRARVSRIHRTPRNDWSLQGRLTIMASHQVRSARSAP